MRAAVCDSDNVRADWGAIVFSWVGGEPDVAKCQRGDCGLRDGDAGRWAGAGAIGFQSFDELSVGGGAGEGDAGGRGSRKDGGHCVDLRRRFCRGRWEEARQPNEKELKATSILRLPLTEVSAKVRVGPPEDDAEDYALGIWAGVLPMELKAGTPIRDERCDAGIAVPGYLANYKR